MRLSLTLSLLASAFLLLACEGPQPAEQALPYEGCAGHEETCADGESICTTVEMRGWGMCTYACTSDAECPGYGEMPAVCEVFSRGARQCALRCDPDADDTCPLDTECVETTRLNGETVALCMKD